MSGSPTGKEQGSADLHSNEERPVAAQDAKQDSFATGAAGGVLIGLDGTGTCAAQGGQACPEQYNTLAPGITLAAVGGALLATSVVLFIVDAKKSKAARRRSALISPWVSAGSAGVVGRWSF